MLILGDDYDRDGPSSNQEYADSWGVRKLISHCLRGLRQDRQPRVSRLIDLRVCMGY